MSAILSVGKVSAQEISAGPSTDIDSLFRLPRYEFAEHVRKAFTNPTRVELDTILVHSWEKYEQNGNFFGAFISDGIYYSNINLIKLHHYIPANNSADAHDAANFKNARFDINWRHEQKHKDDWLKLLKIIATLDVNNVFEIPIHNEIAARLAEEPGRTFDDVIDQASKEFYAYIQNKQFITEIEYMLNVISAQLDMIERTGLVHQYPRVQYKDILKEKYTIGGGKFLERVPNQIRLNELIDGVMNFEEFVQDLAALKKRRAIDIAKIKNQQKILFNSKTGNKGIVR